MKVKKILTGKSRWGDFFLCLEENNVGDFLLSGFYLLGSFKKINEVIEADFGLSTQIEQISEELIGVKILGGDLILEFVGGIFLKYKMLIRGTDFQKKVWVELKKLKVGEIVSYLNIAERIDCRKGVRAVAQAIKKNPFQIVWPCHRVISSNGNIGGFRYGVEIKKLLLSEEGIKL